MNPTEKHTHGRGRKSGGDLLREICGDDPGTQLLFVGSPNCLRHKPFMEIGQWMREGRAALLCPSMTDFATGRYLHQVKDAVIELSRERGSRDFLLMYGCQWVILSTDGELLRQELEEQGITLRFYDDSHLEYGDHWEKEEEE